MITIISNKRLDELKQSLRRANRQNVELETKYKDLKNIRNTSLKTANQEISTLNTKLVSANQKSQELISEVKNLELELSKSKKVNERLGQAQGGLRTSNKRLIDKNNLITKENESLNSELKVANESIKAMQLDIDNLKKEKDSLISMVRKLQSKVNLSKRPKTLEEYKNDGLSKPQKKSLKNIRKKRGN